MGAATDAAAMAGQLRWSLPLTLPDARLIAGSGARVPNQWRWWRQGSLLHRGLLTASTFSRVIFPQESRCLKLSVTA